MISERSPQTVENSSKNVQNRVQADGASFGNKSANLLELQRFCESSDSCKVQIPEIFPLSHDFIQKHLNQYAPQWQKLWVTFVQAQAKSKTLEPAAIEILSEIRKLITDTFLSHPIGVDCTYLTAMVKKSADLMVRSTGKEDDITSANPGGNESVAAVKPDQVSVSSAIGVVVASYFSEKSLRQRLLSPPPSNDITQAPFMPVLLQRMVGEPVADSKNHKIQVTNLVYSGVMYTGEKNITIQIAPGHGELIVNSKAPFDTYFVSRGDIVYPAIYHKKYRLAPIEDEKERKLVFTKNPRDLQEKPSLSIEKALEIAKIGRNIEKHYGMPMDVEFVYSTKEDVIYVVQARPIPQGDRGKLKPSSFPPNQALLLKHDSSIEMTKAAVIAPADNAAKIITKSEEILIEETIERALNDYLAQKKSQVNAVIVKNMAPSTSHEAAQFNAKAIPVLQEENIKQLEEWTKAKKAVLIVDPQRNQIINWTKKIKDHAHAEEELFKDKILEHGQFRSALPPEVTPFKQYDFKKVVAPLLKAKFLKSKDTKSNIEWSQKKIYSALQDQIEILEAAKAGDKNEQANKSLLVIQFLIFKIIGKKVDDPIFQHAALFCADIKSCLDRYSASDEKNNTSIRSELLDLISKLTALITNHGKPLLISDSIYQRMQQVREEKVANSFISKGNKLNHIQFSYFKELIKLRKLILNAELKDKWSKFVLECCQNKRYFLMLTHVIKMMANYNIQSDVLNVVFSGSVEKIATTKQILLNLDSECSAAEARLKTLKLETKKTLIQSWEQRSNEWANPSNFEKLLREFKRDIVPLIYVLSIDKVAERLARKSILKTVQELTELIDRTIKALKSSTEYQSDAQKKLQVARFAQLLELYHQLMNKWMRQIDEKQYTACEVRLFDHFKLGKEGRIAAIQAKFESLKKSDDIRQLNSSGNFSVASARVGSNACFLQQFVEKTVTLEDMFTLMHQNIIACTNFLGRDLQVKLESLPLQIQPLIKEVAKIEIYDNKIDLLNIEHCHPRIQLEYNLPLANHAAKIFVEYDQDTRITAVKFNLYSMNINGRMTNLLNLVSAEGKLLELLGVHVKQSPTYNEASACFEFVWAVKDSNLLQLSALLKAVLSQYAKNTYNRNRDKAEKMFSFIDDPQVFKTLIPIFEILKDKMSGPENKDIKVISLYNQIKNNLSLITPLESYQNLDDDKSKRLKH